MPLAVTLTELDRVRDLDAVIASRRAVTRWMEAAQAYGRHAFVDAAEVLEDMGAPAVGAFARLRAAEALVQEGRRAEADAQLQATLSFYRSVDATAYISEAEGLFAASA
jgi:predicted negative regulator of RcsB-dependent stress response